MINTNNLKQDAQHTLLKLSEWFAANKLSLHKDKSCYTVFASPTKLQSVPSSLNSLCFGNQVINRVHHAKYLGLILDESLSWKEHIESLIKQLSKITNLYKVVRRHHVEKNNKYNIYFAYTYSKILYSIEVYGSVSNAHMNKIQVQQNKSLKILFQKSPKGACYKKNVQIANIVYKHKQGVLRPAFKNYFI